MNKTSGALFLPMDLGYMISYLDKRFQILKIRNDIKLKNVYDVAQKTET